MKSVLTAVCAVAVLAGACGSDEADFVEQLGEIGIPEDQARCVVDELDARGLSVQDVSDQAVGDGDMPAGAAEAVQVCLLGGVNRDVVPDALDLDEFVPDRLDLDGLDLDGLDLDDIDPDMFDIDAIDGGLLGDGDSYGDDPALDALWDSCAAGDGAACDELYWTSPLGSRYEDFGNTCGDRYPDGVLSCEDTLS